MKTIYKERGNFIDKKASVSKTGLKSISGVLKSKKQIKLSDELTEIIQHSSKIARHLRHPRIQNLHFLLALVLSNNGTLFRVFRQLNIQSEVLLSMTEQELEELETCGKGFSKNPRHSDDANHILQVASLEAKLLRSEKVCPEHLLLSILRFENDKAAQILIICGLNYETVKMPLHELYGLPVLTTGRQN